MYIPRFGADYARSIAEGVGTVRVLNKNGVGHYPGTQMPGQVGNFAVAAHRTTHGAPFNSIATLRVGDRIYVQTEQGYYTYVYRNTEYVYPNGVGVKNPVPQSKTPATSGQAPDDDQLQPQAVGGRTHRGLQRLRVVAAVVRRSAGGDSRTRTEGKLRMYGALWRILPGPAWVRILELLVLLAIVLFVLVEWVFPWLNTFVNVNDVTVEP